MRLNSQSEGRSARQGSSCVTTSAPLRQPQPVARPQDVSRSLGSNTVFSTLISLSKKEAPGAKTVRSTCFLKNAALHAAFGIKLLIYIKKKYTKALGCSTTQGFSRHCPALARPGRGCGGRVASAGCGACQGRRVELSRGDGAFFCVQHPRSMRFFARRLDRLRGGFGIFCCLRGDRVGSRQPTRQIHIGTARRTKGAIGGDGLSRTDLTLHARGSVWAAGQLEYGAHPVRSQPWRHGPCGTGPPAATRIGQHPWIRVT